MHRARRAIGGWFEFRDGWLQLGFVLAAMAVLSALGPAIGAEGNPGSRDESPRCLTSLAEYPLPELLQKANDIRWAGDNAVFVSSWRAGVYRLSLDGKHTPIREISRGDGLDEIWLPFHIAASEKYLAAAAPVFALAWKQPTEMHLEAQAAFAVIVDIDLFGDRLLILGARRDDQGKFAPDSAIAWTGPLSEDLTGLEPIVYSEAGPRVWPINYCAVAETGNVRFLPDGASVVVPGVEQGVLLYDANGKLERTWQSDALGFDAGCVTSDEERKMLARDEPARWAWVNQRRTVDDILPLAEGPGLLIRTRGPRQTTWQLKILDRNSGGVTTCDVPISSPSSLTQLHVDVDGDRVVFLLWVHGPGGRLGGPPVDLDAPPEVPPRLFTMRLRR